jgi:hypothetical protein
LQLADETAEGMLCHHDDDFMDNLRLRRDLDTEERNRARCHVCGRIFRQFLLQCRGCRTIMCLDCRDWLQEGSLEEGLVAGVMNVTLNEA